MSDFNIPTSGLVESMFYLTCCHIILLETRSVSANDMFVQVNARKERKGNTILQYKAERERGESWENLHLLV